MQLYVHHRTDYRFSEPQARVVQLLRLTPIGHAAQNVVSWRIDVDCDARLKRARDGYGNEITMLYVDGPIERIALSVSGVVLTEDHAGLVSGTVETLPPLYFRQSTPLTRADAAIRALAAAIDAEGGSALDKAHRLNHHLHDLLEFDAKRTATDRDAATTLAEGHGIGRDYAHLYIAAARAMDLPARYVSGHRYHADGEPDQGPHGWAEAHVDDYGWVAFDPSCGLCPHDAYVRVAIGLDYREAAPVSGARIGGGHELLDIGVHVGLSQAQVQG